MKPPARGNPVKPGAAEKDATSVTPPRTPRSAAVNAAPMPAKSAAPLRSSVAKAGDARAGKAPLDAAVPKTPPAATVKPGSPVAAAAQPAIKKPAPVASKPPAIAPAATAAVPAAGVAPKASGAASADLVDAAPAKPGAATSPPKPAPAPKAPAKSPEPQAVAIVKPQPNPANAIVSPPPPSPGRPGTPTGPRSGTGRPFSTFRSARPQSTTAGRGLDEQQDAAPFPTDDTGASEPSRSEVAAPKPNLKPVEFRPGDHVVYPTHGVGTVQGIETMQAAGMSLQMIVVTFDENRMTLKVPIGKAASSGLRKLATGGAILEALETLKGRARIKRTMWSRRAQEYEAKINSGDPVAIAEVVRDLHRNAGQPDQSFSERQIYEQAMDRLAAEVAAIDGTDKVAANEKLLQHLSKAA